MTTIHDQASLEKEYDPITDLVKILTETHGWKIEQWMRLYIRKRPWWIPQRTYKWLINKLVLVTQTQSRTTKI